MTTLGKYAAAYNACMLVANMGFTRWRDVAKYDRSLFSKDGQISVLLWGAAYLAAQEKSPIFLVFAIEKLFYVVRWLQWMRENDGMGEIKKAFRSNDKFKILAPLFHSTYGTGDFLFGVLFFLTWLGAI